MENTNDDWRPIPSHLDYEVNQCGDIRRINEHERLVPTLTHHIGIPHGYPVVRLPDCGAYKVHIAVARAFLGEPNGLCVRHLDGDKTNCHLSNLAYGTISENAHDRKRHGTNKLNDLQVRVIRRLYTAGLKQVDIANIFGISQQHVSRLIRNLQWSVS